MLDFLKVEKIVAKDAKWNKIPFYRPVPSEDCRDGYSDRIGIHEVLAMSNTIKNLMTKNAVAEDVHQQAKKEGMMTMIEDGIVKAAQGITSIEEVLRVTRE